MRLTAFNWLPFITDSMNSLDTMLFSTTNLAILNESYLLNIFYCLQKFFNVCFACIMNALHKDVEPLCIEFITINQGVSAMQNENTKAQRDLPPR
jgi:hypothetical protein